MAPPTAITGVPSATVEQVLSAAGAVLVDLRSPAEHAEDHLPGAHSLPLFDDLERAIVGTLYRRASPGAAFESGRAIAAARIRALVRGIGELGSWEPPEGDLERLLMERTGEGLEALDRSVAPEAVGELPERPIVLCCWRGGLRSRSVAAFLRELGCERALALAGGHRAWRSHVMRELGALELPRAHVLRGLTGTGKTLVLRAIERLRPRWTLDLEALAGHRSSILGMVGLEPCSQKTFETRLLARVERGFAGPLVLEGESRKVGNIVLPVPVWRALDGGWAFELRASPERRIDVLIEDYLARETSRAELARQLPFLEQRLGARHAGRLVEMLATGRERELVALLLERYYDPLYRHSERGRSYLASFDSTDPEETARAIVAWIESAGNGAS